MKYIFLFISICQTSIAWAQLPPACAGGSPATACASACINCDFNGYVGSTAGYPSGIVPNFCGTVENAQWMGFIAGSSTATFSVTPSNCSDGNGIQIALYEDCTGDPLACEMGEMDGGALSVSMDVQITPGRNYFLMIDGFAGDQCDFSVSVSPNNAVYEPPLGTVGSITGPDAVCPGATMSFTVNPVSGAGAYIWSGPPGAMIDSVLLPVTQVGTGANIAQITFGTLGGQVCVQAANSCSQSAPCSIPFNVTMLDDSYRPVLDVDTVQHLTCSGEPAILNVSVQATSDFIFQWSSDSSGHIVAGANIKAATVDKTGTYTLSVTNSQNGCNSTVDIQVGEPDTPRTADIRLKNITCFEFQDGLISVQSVEGGLAPYVYSLDGEDLSTTPEFRNLMPGNHHLVIETADECRWDTVIYVSQPNDFILDLGQDTTIHLGSAVTLFTASNLNEPDRMEDLKVRPTELFDLLCDGCMYIPDHTFRYTVTVTDSNGCQAIADRIVSVTKERYVYAPNVFKPESGSEGNQLFTLFGGEDVAQIAWLRVFDRWGQLVYEQTDLSPNNSNSGWDGKVQGQVVPPNVFVWQAEIEFIDGEIEKWSGTVTLVR